MKKQVAVIGIGRFGRSVATELYNLGHDVLAIDKIEERVQDMLGKVTYPVSGDATNESTLRELGIAYDMINYIIEVKIEDPIEGEYRSCPELIKFSHRTPFKSMKNLLAPIIGEDHKESDYSH